jgi:uncharacterized protein (UPF0335 family)
MLQVVEKPDAKTGGIAADRLRSLVERIERVSEERKALSNDIGDLYKEVASAGYDKKAVKCVIRVRAGVVAYDETDALVNVYRAALGC